MWFKNIQIYEFIESFDYQPERLCKQLEDFEYTPCASTLPATMGWYPPSRDEEGTLVHAANGYMLVCLRIEEKVIPAAVVTELLEERVQEIEHKQGRKVGRKERLMLKEDTYDGLIPRAFSKSAYMYAYIDTHNGWLLIDTPSASKAEMFIAELRKALGSLKVQVPDVLSPSVMMTHWLKSGKVPTGFKLEDFCVLQNSQQENSLVRCQKHDLDSDAIHQFLEEGFVASQVALSWYEQLSVVLKDDFSLTRLRFLDVVQEKISDTYTETPQERFDADFSIMTETLQAFLLEFMNVFRKEASVEIESYEADVEEVVPA